MIRYFVVTVYALAFAPTVCAQSSIEIAIAGPMTGQYARSGAQMKAGAELAVEDINAKGGINGQHLTLIVEDDACDAQQATAIAGKLAARAVKLVAGHYCSDSSIRAARVYAGTNVIQISPGSSHPKFTDERAGANVFRLFGRDDQQAIAAGRFLLERFAGKKIAVVHDRSAYGKGLADGVVAVLSKSGVKPSLYEAYFAGEKDYSALALRMKAAGIDLVYVGGYHVEAALIIRGMRDRGMNTVLMSSGTLATPEFWQIAGTAGEGSLMTFRPDPSRYPAARIVAARLDALKVDARGAGIYTFAAIQAWAQAVAATKSTEAKAVADYLNSTELESVLGPVKFDRKGDTNLPSFSIFAWMNGEYVQLD